MVTPLGMLREFSLKLLTTGFQRFDLRDAIDFHLSVKVEDIVAVYLLSVPLLKRCLLFGTHPVGVVYVGRWHGTLIVLIGQGIEEMREGTFT